MLTVVYPEGLNWFYSHQAALLASGLTSIGVAARKVASTNIEELRQASDLALMISAWECIESAERAGCGGACEDALRRYDRRVLLNYDSIHSRYFSRHFVGRAGLVTEVLDVSAARQTDFDYLFGAHYRWIPEAFCNSEISTLRGRAGDRPIPWVVLAHVTPSRVTLTTACADLLGRGGFFFMPRIRPFDAVTGLDRDAIHAVLSRANLYVWGSHHAAPYHEGLRALHAVSAGAVPAKIDPLHAASFPGIPWVYESVSVLGAAIAGRGFAKLYEEAKAYLISRGSMENLVADAFRTDRQTGPVVIANRSGTLDA